MKHPTQEEKDLVSHYLARYARTRSDVTVKQCERLVRWLNGATMQNIAKQEGVTYQAIQISIKKLFNKVKEFASYDDNAAGN